MLVPGRSYVDPSRDYRYGFQGQEMDNELKGRGNSLNYTFRMHDPRVGRFFATDPLEKKYPFYSPYAFSGNRVIDAVEIEGLEPMGVDIIMTMAKFWIKSKLGLQNNVNSMMGPVTKNNETINNNILLDEKAKEFYYKADAIAGASSISGKIFVAGGVTSGVVVGGGAVFAETSLLSAAGATLNTELGYLASSGPLWIPAIQSQFTINTARTSFVGGGSSYFSQYLANGFTTEGMDYGDVLTSSTLGGNGGLFISSFTNITAKDGFTTNSIFDTGINYIFGKSVSNLNKNIGNTGSSLFNTTSIGGYLQGITNTVTKTGSNLFKKELKSNIESVESPSFNFILDSFKKDGLKSKFIPESKKPAF